MKVLVLLLLFVTGVHAQWTPRLVKLEADRWRPVETVARAVESHHPKIKHGFLRASSWRETKHVDTTRVESNLFNVGARGADLVIRTARDFVTKHPNGVPFTIERLQEATSYHKHQILGLNYRLYGDTTTFLAQISDSLEFEFTCRFMEDLLSRYHNWPDALAAYNGGDGAVRSKRKRGRYLNQGYVNELLKNIARFTW